MRRSADRCFSAIMAAALLCLSGCANTPLNHEPGLFSQWRGQSAYAGPVPDLSVVLHPRFLVFGQPAGFDLSLKKWRAKRGVGNRLEEVMEEFPVLGNARLDAEEADYRLYIESTHSIEGNKTLKTISGITKYAIPSSEHNAIELEARLYRGQEEIERYSAIGHYKVRWFLLILLAPWMWHLDAPGEVMEDAFRDLFIQIQEDAPSVFAGASGAAS